MINTISEYKALKNIASFNKKKENNRELLKKGIGLTAAGYVGQQTIRSGVPRALGVRLESHSTSKKDAKKILKEGGYIDPNKSGTKATKILEHGKGLDGVTDYDKAKNKVYITGIHKDNIDAEKYINNPFGQPVKIKGSTDDPIADILNRKSNRRGYRLQSAVDWDKVAKAANNPSNVTPEQKLTSAVAERTKQLTKLSLIPNVGRSLYIGGSDDYFNKNFKPDFDDIRSMYSEKPVKVYGNRASATLAAIKREGLGNLIKSNPGRVAGGLGILGFGTALTGGILHDTGLIKLPINKRKYNKKDNNYWSNLTNKR